MKTKEWNHAPQNIISNVTYSFYLSGFMPGRAPVNKKRKWAIKERAGFAALSSEDRNTHILTFLQDQVKYCRQYVPYYRDLLKDLPKKFPLNFEEYHAIPELTKEIIRNVGDSLISDEFNKNELRKHVTGGSTGEPLKVYLSVTEEGLGDAGNEFFMRQIGGEIGKRVGTLYGGELDISISTPLTQKIKNWILNYSAHGCFRLDNDYLLDVHRDFKKFAPDVLVGYSSALFLLADFLKTNGIKPTYPRNAIITAAEKLETYQRKTIESIFSTPVVERYGSRELGLIGYQLPGCDCFHIDNWDLFVEPESTPDQNGLAPLIITRLHTKAMPLLRYKIGDVGVFPEDWRADEPVTILKEVKGRLLDWIHLPGGRSVHGSEFPHLFKDFDILLYQVVQEADGAVVVIIVPAAGFNDDQRFQCEKIIKNNLIGVPITFRYEKEISRGPQNKLHPVISHYNPGV